MYFKYFSFLFLFLIANLSQGQQIHQSRGLMIFNQGEYRVAIDSLMQFAEKSSSEKGIAYYFIGECYYNLGLDTPNPSQALNFYREAGHYFELAIQETDLGTIYQDKFNEAKYKWAWSTFRQAELVSNPMIHLKQVITK